jgi:hypothetical protein
MAEVKEGMGSVVTVSGNKELWDRVCMTDPSAVKKITGKPYQGSSPKPYWLIERATEVFGPIGIGWGVTVKSERFERVSDTDVLHVAVVSVWYKHNGVKTESFDQMGGTKAVYMQSNGKLNVDEDAGKKSITDGMVKCLSMIGFAGDIFSGRWDDSNYVEHARETFEEKAAAKHRAAWLDAQAGALEDCKTLSELTDTWAAAYKVMKAEKDTEAVATLTPIKDRMKMELASREAA